MDLDPRAVRVETSVADFYRVVAAAPGFTTTRHGTITTFVSGLRHPLLNGVLADAPLAPGTEQQCVDEAIRPLQSAGTPFLWWCGPSVWSAGLERALTARGVQVEALPGMHCLLDEQQVRSPPAQLPAGAQITLGDDVPLEEFTRMMVTGFDLPPDLLAPFTDVLAHFGPEHLVNALATLDGATVGCGSLLHTGSTGGIYNVATLEPARRRGIGYAVTAALVDAARERGCRESVLVATPLGEPVYRRLGFEPVCVVHECLWEPG